MNIRLAVCVPCKEYVISEFSLKLHKLLKYNIQNKIDTEIFYDYGTLISHQREFLAINAIKWGATHILWLDSDMCFPENIAEILLSHNKDVVCGNYMTRRPPHFTVALAQGFDEIDINDKKNFMEINPNRPDEERLVKVKLIGMGCMLTDTKIFKNVPRPWFEIKCQENNLAYIGEDAYFCNKIGQYGYQIFVDDKVSMNLKHIGLFAIGSDKIPNGNFNNKYMGEN